MKQSFSYLKMIKTRLCSRLSDCSVAQLIRMSIEGLKLMQWNLRKYWRFSKNIYIIEYYFDCVVELGSYCYKLIC